MKIKALCSFCGTISMGKGETRECSNEKVVNDLLRAGYVEMAEMPSPEKTTEKTKKPARKKGGDKS